MPATFPPPPEINGPAGGYRLGRYSERPVPRALRPVAEVAWSYVADGAARRLAHRIVAEPGVSLFVEGRVDERGAVATPTLMVMGPIRTPRLFEPTPGTHMGGVRLKVEWCRDLLGIDPEDRVDRIDPADPALLARLGLRAGRVPVPTRRDPVCAVLWAALEELWALRTRSPGASLAHVALEHLRHDPAAAPGMADLARSVGVSARHLRRVVKDHTGAPPKTFHRVRRVQRVVSHASGPLPHGWSGLAHRIGYADQAHLVRDVRALTGTTPTELRAERTRHVQEEGLPGPGQGMA